MRTQALKLFVSLILIAGFGNVAVNAQPSVKSVGSVRHGTDTQVTVVFSGPVDPVSGATPGNYTFSGGVIVTTGASMMTGLPPANALDVAQNPAPAGRAFDNECVVLTITGLAPDATATITIQNVKDTATPPNTIPSTTITFKDSGYAWAESGTPALAGKVIAVGTNGFDIFSAGSAQWANYDEVVMVHKQVTGDFDLKARVEFQDFSSRWGRAGVMAREVLNVGENGATQATNASRYADVHPNPVKCFNNNAAPVIDNANNAWESHVRLSTGGQTGSFNATPGAPPYPNAWVRIQRVGGDIHTFHGSDGVNWDPAADRFDADWLDADGTTPKPLIPQLYVGPAFGPETGNIAHPEGQNRLFLYQVRFTAITVPYVRLVDPNPSGVLILIEDAPPPGTQVVPSTVQLTFDGNPVVASATKSGTTTTVAYKAASPFAANSSHSISLTFKDNATPANSQKVDRNFTIPNYKTIPAGYALANPATDPGLKAQVYQIDFVRGPGDEDSIANAEQQWARGFINPATSQPYPNVANATAQAGPINVDVVNWNGAMDAGWPYTGAGDPPVGVEIGDFQSTNPPPMNILDVPIPGIPGSGVDPRTTPAAWAGVAVNNIVAELETYLHLTPGGYRMGVNSDDGFKCTVAPGAPNPFGLLLGSFSGTRGSSDSTFDFVVTADGYYPFRLLWWQGGGGANLEWFIVDLSTGLKYLINQNDPNAVKAFRTGQGRAYVNSLLPADGYTGAETNSPIQVVLANGSTTVVNGSITLTVDGAPVTPVINSGATTTVTYNNPGGWLFGSTHSGTLIWGESTTPQTTQTNNFSFAVRLQGVADLPTNSFWIEAEDFDNSGGAGVPAAANTMPYGGGAYDTVGAIHDVDYHRNDTGPFNGTPPDPTMPSAYAYRTGIPAELNGPNRYVPMDSQTGAGTLDVQRPGGFDATINYKIGWAGNGVWYNYTRQIPAGLYTAMAALSEGDSARMTATLSKVTAGVGTSNQTLVALGTFDGPSSGGWGNNNLVPFKAPDGSQAVFKITGTGPTTLRYTEGVGDFDWFVLFPVTGIPPKVTAASPLANTAAPAASAVPKDAKVRLTIEDFSTALVLNSVKVFFDGADVTSSATITKPADITTVTYSPGLMAGGSTHSYELRFTDGGTPAVTQTNKATFTVSAAIGTPGQFLIEAEDFDTGGGQAQAPANTMPYLGGAYANLGAVLNVDYFDADAADSFPYRPSLTNKVNGANANVNMDQQTDAGTLDVVRGDTWTMTSNYKIGWTGAGDWFNYTRTFPANTYEVWAALSHDPSDGLRGSLSLVTGGVGTPNQTAVTLGKFNAPTSGGWGNNNLVQMKDNSGNALAVSLSGVQTVRFNADSGDFDYLLFAPSAATPSKWITSVGVTGANITIKWIGGGTLQSTPSLPATTWTDLGTGGTFSEAVGPGGKFYRARE